MTSDSEHVAAPEGFGRPRASAWVAALLAIPMALPILTIIVLAATSDWAAWPQLLGVVLPRLALTTALLGLGCGILTLIMGTVMAWLVTMYNFPGRPFLKWAPLLPLAMPGYIISFAYVDFFTYSGRFQEWLRGLFGWTRPDDYVFPDIRSLPGAIVVLSFALFPYVYMSARAAFMNQPMNQLHVARTLGRTPWQAFLDITLPQARPALAVGVVLVLMECFNDIGAVSFFGVRTLTLAIYSTWLDQGDLGGAAQLAVVMLAGIMALIMLEQMARSRDSLIRAGRHAATVQRHVLTGWRGGLACVVMGVPVFMGFFLPVLLLIGHAWRRAGQWITPDFAAAVANSILLALIACGGTLVIALVMAYSNRQSGSALLKTITRLASLGYALPGTVLGIGILIPFGQFDQITNRVLDASMGWKPGLILSGSIAGLAFAYITRFLIIAFGTVESGLEKISYSLDHVSRTLGRTPLRSFFDIHMPLLRSSLVTAALLVFVDAMKELPATLILRPFDFDTLATRVFTLASLGQLEDSAVPALAIVLAGLVPVILLARALRESSQGR